MFSWKIKRAGLDPVYRVIYTMQFIAVIAMFAGLFLAWWDADEVQNAWHLFERSTREIRRRDVNFLAQPLLLLWLMWPSLIISAGRSATGIAVQPVAFRRLALRLWIASLLPLAHYYINYGESVTDQSPLTDGVIGIGYWLTASATAILGGLLLVETLLKEPEQRFERPADLEQTPESGGVEWESHFIKCPFCGTLNDKKARVCFSCKNLLFSYERD